MDLSVIICTYNRARSLARTLQAICSQVVPREIRWELILVDNNSSDETSIVIEAYRSKIPVPVNYLFENRQGKSFALNSAIKKASGKILVFTDDDVSPQTDWLEKIVDSMTRHDADGVGGKILLRWASPPPSWLSAEEHLWRRFAILDCEHFSRIGSGVPMAQIYGANMAFKRDLFAEIGEFDTTLGPTGEKLYRHEESDFVTRALAKEKRLFYDPNIIVWHYVSQERMRKNYFRKWYFDDGENKGLRFGVNSGRKLVGIPLWYLRITGVNFLKWIGSCFRTRSNRFLAELELWEDLGFCQGRLRSVLTLRSKREHGSKKSASGDDCRRSTVLTGRSHAKIKR